MEKIVTNSSQTRWFHLKNKIAIYRASNALLYFGVMKHRKTIFSKKTLSQTFCLWWSQSEYLADLKNFRRPKRFRVFDGSNVRYLDGYSNFKFSCSTDDYSSFSMKKIRLISGQIWSDGLVDYAFYSNEVTRDRFRIEVIIFTLRLRLAAETRTQGRRGALILRT